MERLKAVCLQHGEYSDAIRLRQADMILCLNDLLPNFGAEDLHFQIKIKGL